MSLLAYTVISTSTAFVNRWLVEREGVQYWVNPDYIAGSEDTSEGEVVYIHPNDVEPFDTFNLPPID